MGEQDVLAPPVLRPRRDADRRAHPRVDPADRRPDAEHPAEGVRILRAQGYPDNVCDAILGHAAYTGVPRETRLARTLYAVDELSGFIAACALVRPTGILSSSFKASR